LATRAAGREHGGDLGASAGGGVDLERSAEEFGALPHDVEPEPIGLRPEIESAAVIADG
jgi:hypothetical protein